MDKYVVPITLSIDQPNSHSSFFQSAYNKTPKSARGPLLAILLAPCIFPSGISMQFTIQVISWFLGNSHSSPVGLTITATGCLWLSPHPLESSKGLQTVSKQTTEHLEYQCRLVHLGCYQKISLTQRLKEQIFICHRSGGWDVQDQGTGRSGVYWDPSAWFADDCLFGVTPHGREREREWEREWERERE